MLLIGEETLDKTWYDAECITELQPQTREENTSDFVVYIRKDFKFVPERIMDDGTAEPCKWIYKEATIPKDVVELLNMTDKNSTDIVDIENAMCELSMRGVV